MIEITLTSWTPVISSDRNLKRWKAAYIVEKPQTLGWDCSGSGVICSYCCLRKLYFYDQEGLQITIFAESLQSISNAHPAFC